MIYSIPYIILTTILGISAWWHTKTESKVIQERIELVNVLFVVFFFGFRGFCFYDWNTYYPAFLHISWNNLMIQNIKDWEFEPGFMLLMAACKSIVNNYFFFEFVCTIIDFYLLIKFLRNKIKNIPLALMICISMGGLLYFTDLIRNSIAVLLIINAFGYIEKKQPIPYILICFVALCFHSSSLLFFPLYFIINKSLNRWIWLTIFIIGNLIYLLHIPIFLTLISFITGLISPGLQDKINSYTLLLPNEEFRLSIGYLERLLTGILTFCYIRKLRGIRKNNDIYINSMLIYFIMFFYFSEFKTISLRLSNLFGYAYWIIWIDLIKCFSIENNRKLFVTFIGLYCIFKMWGSTNNIIARYDNILFDSMPYHERVMIFNKYYNTI